MNIQLSSNFYLPILAYNDNFLTPSVFLYFLIAFYHKEKLGFSGKRNNNYDGRPNFFGFINGLQYIIITYFDTKIVLGFKKLKTIELFINVMI